MRTYANIHPQIDQSATSITKTDQSEARDQVGLSAYVRMLDILLPIAPSQSPGVWPCRKAQSYEHNVKPIRRQPH